MNREDIFKKTGSLFFIKLKRYFKKKIAHRMTFFLDLGKIFCLYC